MTLTDPNLAMILVFCMAVLLLIQTVALVVVLHRASERVRKTEAAIVRITGIVRDRMRETQETLEQLAWINERMPLIEEKANTYIDAAGSRLVEFDEKAGETIQKATARIEDTGRKIEFGLAQFNRQTTQLIREVHYPAAHVSAVLKGVSAGVKAWRQKSTSIPFQDEESFI